MPYAELARRSHWWVMWACVCSVMILSGCGTTSKTPARLDVPKPVATLPPEVIKRVKPESSMLACDELPGLPPTLITKSGKEQAEYVLNVWSDAVQAHTDCSIKQAALVEWIRQD